MVGEGSGLSPETIEKLKSWLGLFNDEMHGSGDAQRVVNCLGPPLSLIPLGSENHQRDAAGASPAHLEAAGRPHHAAVA